MSAELLAQISKDLVFSGGALTAMTTVGTVAVALTQATSLGTTQLSERRALIVHNTSAATLWITSGESVAKTQGYPLGIAKDIVFPVSREVNLFVLAETVGPLVATIELW